MSDVLQKVETGVKPLAKLAAIFSTLAALGVAYWFYMDNIYRPKAKVISVDYDKGIAQLDMAGVTHTLYAGSQIAAGGHWAVRFAGKGDDQYDRVELVKNDITYKVIDLAPSYSQTLPTITPIKTAV